MREVRRILVIRTDRMGDALMNLPALHRLRQNFPKAWMTLLCDGPVAPFFKDHPDLDEVLAVDAKALERDALSRRALIKKIRGIGYDLAVVANAGKYFHWLVFICGIPLRVGWRRKWPFLLNRSLPDTKSQGHSHEIDSNLALVGLVCAKPWDGALRLGSDEASLKQSRSWLDAACGSKSVIVVHAGTSNDEKKWPAENFIQLCGKIRAEGKHHLVFVGGGEEAALSRQIAGTLGDGALDLTGKTSWKQLAALFNDERVRTLVSSDSAPVHLAWMSGKPVVALYAKNCLGSDPVRWGPRDPKSQVIFKSMGEISVGEVWEKLTQVLR